MVHIYTTIRHVLKDHPNYSQFFHHMYRVSHKKVILDNLRPLSASLRLKRSRSTCKNQPY